MTAHRGWSFNPAIMLGINVLPNLPLEEALFYPLGGALSLLLYAAWSREQDGMGGSGLFIGILTASIAVLATVLTAFFLGRRPYYLCSQWVLFNGLVLGLWPWARRSLRVRPALLAAAVMTVVGFFWNWLAFVQGWWEYHAVLGWTWPARVPVDDWNFYIFAPLAAISLYEIFRKRG